MSGTKRLLIVEDENSQRILLEALAGAYCVVVGVATAAAALEALEKSSFDVVLSDHELGRGITGCALLDQVAVRWPAARRCLMSATPRDTAHHFVAKPIDFDELRRLVAG